MTGHSAQSPGVIGWDVGGAHLKAAFCVLPGSGSSAGPRLVEVLQQPCALWHGLDALGPPVAAVLDRASRWAPAARWRHAVTMTGEMVDGFADRDQGVRAITAWMLQHLPADVGGAPDLRLLALADGPAASAWIGPAQAMQAPGRVASANWWASAQWLAGQTPAACLVDIGSTTTDLVPVAAGRVLTSSRNDHQRLVSGELVYHGVVRTPLCSLGPRIEFDGRTVNLMNEWFATAADVYRVTGELDERHDQHPAADQGAKTQDGSRRRFARLVGLDAADAPPGQWLALARRWRERQLDEIQTNLARVLAQATALPADAPLVAAGCGAFLVPDLAARLGRRCGRFDQVLPLDGDAVDGSLADWARCCAPAAALAALLATLLAATDHPAHGALR